MTTLNPDQKSNTGFYAIVALIVVGMGAALAFAITQRGAADGGRADSETAAVEIDGAPLAPHTGTGSDDVAIGEVAPTLIGTSYDNTDLEIGPDGTPKVILFVAHWCPHCQAEVPKVQAMVDDGLLPEGVDLYTVSTSIDPGLANYPASSWLKEEGWTAPVLADSDTSSAATAYGLSGFPFTVVLDGDNRVLARFSGRQSEAALQQIWQAAAEGSGTDVEDSGESSDVG